MIKRPPMFEEEWLQAISNGSYHCSSCKWNRNIDGAFKQVEPSYCDMCQAMRYFHKNE